ncbi:nuclear transport factor 2 family protein [Flagellimonas meishanensis]|uniref:nuclear transport factor 2 family protein n=1 Tax=Flagellimonas meishanensis TaxID=2873264 RepID=UPI001CA65C8A|nr:nuclear transport factor 2 family protein [[Muricauda] meishanensis]
MGKLLIIGIFLTMGMLSLSAQVSKDSKLYQEIVKMDQIYFGAYNECDMAKQAELYDEDIEFYHDSGGLETNKVALLQSIEDNICGKVTRALVPNSIEVHPIPGLGAVEIGKHSFFNNQEPDAKSDASKFIIIWKQNENNWKISRVISLH